MTPIPWRRTLLLVCLTLLGAQPGWAQGDVSDPTENRALDDDEYLWWPLPEGQQRYAEIDGYELKEHVGELTAIARRSRDDGNQFWGLIAGQPYHDEAAAWIEGRFRRIGLDDVRSREFDLAPQWVPQSWAVRVSTAQRTLTMESSNPYWGSLATPAEGLDLEPVWLGLGGAADLIGRDVRGKAAFILSLPRPTARSHSANYNRSVRRAEEAGAAAVVLVFGMPGNVAAQPGGGGSAPASIPVMVVGLEDGRTVEEMIARERDPRVSIRLETEQVAGLTTSDVWGVLPGATDEFVVVLAHYDGFFEGALDNASGVAGLLGLADYFAGVPRERRRRTMIFVATCCHHGGGGLDGAPTGNLWMAENMGETFERTALIANMEHLSQTQTYHGNTSVNYGEPHGLIYSNTTSARRWYVGGTERLRDVVRESFRTFGVSLYAAQEDRPRGELLNLFRHAPSVHIIDHTFYHSDLDTPALVPAAGLERATQAFARIIDEVNTMDLDEIRGGAYPMVTGGD